MGKSIHLNESKVARFYSIWFPLLHFVNQHRKVVPSFPKEWRNDGVSPEVAVPVRDALWEDDALREAFIADLMRRHNHNIEPDVNVLGYIWKDLPTSTQQRVKALIEHKLSLDYDPTMVDPKWRG